MAAAEVLHESMPGGDHRRGGAVITAGALAEALPPHLVVAAAGIAATTLAAILAVRAPSMPPVPATA